VACELSRTAWGKTEALPGARTATPLRFTGQYEDEETGLHYNHFRYYDPETGRYISPDPIGLEGGTNLFRYVDDPSTTADPFGLSPACRCVIITNNGPADRQIPGTNLFAWKRDSNTGAAPSPQVMDKIPNKPSDSTPGQQRGQCAEPRAITDYQSWLAKQPNPDNQTMDQRTQAGVQSITPMNMEEKRGGNNKVVSEQGSLKAPCGFCGPMLGNMGLGDKVMSPEAAAANAGLTTKKGRMTSEGKEVFSVE